MSSGIVAALYLQAIQLHKIPGIIDLQINAVAVENRLEETTALQQRTLPTVSDENHNVVEPGQGGYVEESGFRSVSRKEQFGAVIEERTPLWSPKTSQFDCAT